MKHITVLFTAVLIGYLPSLSFCQSDRLSNDAKDRDLTNPLMAGLKDKKIHVRYGKNNAAHGTEEKTLYGAN